MKYKKIWEKTLNPGEKIQYEFSIGKGYRNFWLTLSVLAGFLLLFYPSYFIGVIVMAAGVLYYGFYIKIANAYAFTDKRVLFFQGWLSTGLISIDYGKITDVTVDEPILNKLFTQTGHLIINTAGTGFEKLQLKHVESPYELKKKLDQIRNNRQ